MSFVQTRRTQAPSHTRPRDLFVKDRAGRLLPFPNRDIPFSKLLDRLFFDPQSDESDFPIHGPNVVRCVAELVDMRPGRPMAGHALGRDAGAHFSFMKAHDDVMAALLEMNVQAYREAPGDAEKVKDLLRVAALYHDLGKVIRRANHPPLGANLLRGSNEAAAHALLDYLVHAEEEPQTPSRHERFSLIASVIQHHDKYGVVGTGEAALPIFSDIPYYRSERGKLPSIKKNVTSVMLVNLADIAAVCTAPANERAAACELARAVGQARRSQDADTELARLEDLATLTAQDNCFLGLDKARLDRVLGDWMLLMKAIDTTEGDRTQLKARLVDIEQNPARAVQRILRLLQVAATRCGATALLGHLSPTSVENVLVGTLGPHRFERFCRQLAVAAKFDYGLDFFSAIMCACIRKNLNRRYTTAGDADFPTTWKTLTTAERNKLKRLDGTSAIRLAGRITSIVTNVLGSLLARYEEVLDCSSANPSRFGFLLSGLTLDEQVRRAILDPLCCREDMDPLALTWIADEVTVWTMD